MKRLTKTWEKLPQQEAFNGSVYAMNCLFCTPLMIQIFLDAKDTPTAIRRLGDAKTHFENEYEHRLKERVCLTESKVYVTT